MDKYGSSPSQQATSFWCWNCGKIIGQDQVTPQTKCKVCNKVVREILESAFEPSVFPSFSGEPMQVFNTDYELILIVPGKGKSLRFHFSLQRHYYPCLLESGARDRNSVVCKTVPLSALQRDMCDLGRCLPDLDWLTPAEKGASFLMTARTSRRVYKFDSLQNEAKHCFVVDGTGVICDVDREPFNFLVAVRRYEEEPGKDTRLKLGQMFKQCLGIRMAPEEIVQLVELASGSKKMTAVLQELAKGMAPQKKKKAPSDSDDELMSFQPSFKGLSFSQGASGSGSDSEGSDH